MPNLLQKAGAQGSKPARYGVLWHNNFYLGVVTQRNPLHSFLQHVEEEFYGTQPCLIDGLNTEISTKLTIVRRPGSTIYNTAATPGAVNRFYENRVSIFNATQTSTTESIQVLADTASNIYDVTGPSTFTNIFTKATGAGSTYFQSVGNELFFSDGPEQKKLITPNLIWAANQTFNAGNQILDPNGNLQIVQGTGTATITEIAVVSTTLGVPGGPTLYFLQVTFSSDVFWTQGTSVSFSGIGTYTSLNNQTQTVVVNPAYLTPSSTVAYFTTGATATYGPVADTGTATSTNSTGSGTSGASAPAWNASLGGYTTDNQLTWQNFGPPLYNWATAAPVLAPTISPAPGTRYWTPNTTLPNLYSIMTNLGQVQYVSAQTGPTGSVLPTWNTQVPVGSASGGDTIDGGVTWENAGVPGTWAPATTYPVLSCIIDSNGNLQLAAGGAATGSTPPTWMTTLGATTTDGSTQWFCMGPGTIIISGSVYYAYSWVSTDGSVTTSSPFATQNYGTFVLGPKNSASAILSGSFPTDPQTTAVWIWRSVQGGSSSALFFDSAIPNPTPGTASNWAFTDVLPDTFLDELIEAPIADQNNPPPVGLTALAYHLGRIWGAVGTTVFNSQTSGIVGNPYTSWDPEDFFTFPSNVIRLYPTSNGLIVLTVSDIYVIQGLGDSSSSFFSTPFLQGIGLGNYDGFAVNGAIAYLYTTDNQVCSIDLSSGFSEVGFQIGDQFGPNNGTESFTPSSAFLTWHFDGSEEKALYVSDRIGSWWRMLPTPSPETGTNTWCPRALILSGFSAVQSVETSPGVHTLLLGPTSTRPILQRNTSVYSDVGVFYNAYAVIGSLVLAQPGQLAYAKLITTDSVAVGTPITLQVQLDEISSITGINPNTLTVPLSSGGHDYQVGDVVDIVQTGGVGGTAEVTSISGFVSGPVRSLKLLTAGENYFTQTGVFTTGGHGFGLLVNITSGGLFEPLVLSVPDPTQLSASLTLNAQRFYLSQTQQPAVCRHMQIAVEFGTDTVKNELLSLTVYGSFEQEN